ncbi:radical SAM/SPASM domain-containing protein [Endomicrobiia bacterium]|nr:radical SAM/SPASM domain-containing protein [Endomicrobiia bacterium]
MKEINIFFDSLNLTVAITNECNLNCIFCYVNKDNIYKLSARNYKNIINFIKRYYEDHKIKNLFITWSGGEPLIDLDNIIKLSEEIINFCCKNDIHYKSNIITNAVLLNKETVKILQKVGVSNIQVSIEPTEILDSLNRPIKNTNKSNFNNTYENVKNTAELISIVLRIALSKKNFNQIVSFVEKLKNDNLFFNKVNFALGPLHIPYLNSQLDYAILNDIFDSREYSNIYFDIYEELFNKNIINFTPYPELYKECGAYKNNVFVIDANGDIFKCFENVFNRSESIGNIRDKSINLTYKYTDWIKKDFDFEKLECYHCKLLPICKGGCNMVRRFKKETNIGNFLELGCSEWKYEYEKGLRLYYKSLKKNGKD